jgi:hypothetical protein
MNEISDGLKPGFGNDQHAHNLLLQDCPHYIVTKTLTRDSV